MSKIVLQVNKSAYLLMSEYSDLLFKVGNIEIKANKCVLAGYSDYFKSIIKYADDDVIEINDFEHPNSFKFIIYLVYDEYIRCNGDKDKVLLTDEEMFEAISFLHMSCDFNLFNFCVDQFLYTASSILKLCKLRTLVKNNNELLRIDGRIKLLLEKQEYEYFDLDELSKQDAKYLVENCSLERLISEFGIDIFYKSVDRLSDFKVDFITKYLDKFIDRFGNKTILDLFLNIRDPKLLFKDGKYLIAYPFFPKREINKKSLSFLNDSSPTYSIPLFSGMKIHHVSNSDINEMTFVKMNKKLSIGNKIGDLTITCEDNINIKDGLDTLFYIPKGIEIHNLNLT